MGTPRADEEQVAVFNLAPLAISKADKRYRPTRYHQAIETETLSQAVIVSVLRNRLAELIPERLEYVRVHEQQQRQELAGQLERQ